MGSMSRAALEVALGLALIAAPLDAQDRGCFQRSYDKAHLAAHPDQHIASLLLWIQENPIDPKDRYDWGALDATLSGQGASGGRAGEVMDQLMLCYADDPHPRCAVECDGGGFDIVRSDATGITIETAYMLIGSAEGCGGALDLAEVPGQAVRYRLNRVADELCDDLVYEVVAE